MVCLFLDIEGIFGFDVVRYGVFIIDYYVNGVFWSIELEYDVLKFLFIYLFVG